MKGKMQRKIDTMTRAEISDSIEKHLRKIDFDNSRWVKSRIHYNKLRRKTKEDAIQEIFDMKMKILQVFMKHETDIHTAVDPEGLEDISRVFDLLTVMESVSIRERRL